MQFFDLVDISERYMELINPSTPEKILTIGRACGMRPGTRVIEFGAGYGEPLVLWAERYGISGVGVEVRPNACERARRKIADRGLGDRLEIVCQDGAAYRFEPGAYDVAACVGASFIWGGFQPAIQAMRPAARPGGRLVIGEPYWLTGLVPPAYAQRETTVHTERQLLDIVRQEGYDIQYLVRGSRDDWDRYEADNWHALIRWIEENPDHPERQQVIDHLHRSQEHYLTYGRQYLGWAIYVLAPRSYA